ncbi:MAG: DUF4982 domain-containing protein, partial [Sedimentisphaerales bacterium]|nr:DUF4982 domain-containing protein [Sedimentisphaerales bacterium]
MNKKYLTVVIGIATCLVSFFSVGCTKSAAKNENLTLPHNTICFDDGWLFARFGDTPAGYVNEPADLQAVALDDSSWRKLDLPHDWGIETDFLADQPNSTGKLMFQGIGWYRKHFQVDAADAGHRYTIQFDGIMSCPTVFLNGKKIGEWKYGYSSFALDLTDAIIFGENNILAVRVDNLADSARWYPGGGIYRHVWLSKDNPVHLALWGTYITTPEVNKDSAIVNIATELENNTNATVNAQYKHTIAKKDTGIIVARSENKTIVLKPGINPADELTVTINKPELWDTQNPELYVARTEITVDGKVTDINEQAFGIRSIEWNADKGFILNGQIVKIKGVCNHHDLGPLGSAVNRRAIQRQLEIMQEMGVNAIRTSHNPPAPELLDLCDEMGLLVMDEAFDCWARGKTRNDYHLYFKDWYERDITNLVRRDRNHPCVILWSSGNEILEQQARPEDLKVSRELTAMFHKLDPTRPVAAGCNHANSYLNGFGKTIDVYGFNYKPHLYGDFKDKCPNQPVFSSESSSCISSRGEYFFPVSEKQDGGFFNYQVSSYDLYAPGWAMKPDIEFIGQDKFPFVAGEFVWTGFDYIGEPTPYNNDSTLALNFHNEAEKKAIEEKLAQIKGSPSRSSYFGIVDLCGFKKDRFYIYQARWRPELPMAHLLPHWTWPGREGEITPVHVYTSGDEAELFLNGKSLGRKTKDRIGDPVAQLEWPKAVSGKSASASTSQAGHDPAHACDMDPATRWCASSPESDNSWQIDLGSVKNLSGCSLYWEHNSAAYSYEVQISADSQNWSTVTSANFDGNNPASLHEFEATGRYLKVKFTGLQNNRWASFYECQVFGQGQKPELTNIYQQPEYYRLRWDQVCYEPGILEVIAYKDGKKWAKDKVVTAGEPYTLRLIADRPTITADGCDLSFVTVEVVDKNGNFVPRADNMIKFTINGPGTIAATDNGDATNP